MFWVAFGRTSSTYVQASGVHRTWTVVYVNFVLTEITYRFFFINGKGANPIMLLIKSLSIYKALEAGSEGSAIICPRPV